MKKSIFTLIILFVSLINIVFAQNANNKIVKIPDANFEQALIDLKIDSDGIVNGQILTDDAIKVDSLNVLGKNIKNLTGIEAFVNLTYLNCGENELKHLDISKNTALNFLVCFENKLTSLDFSKNTALTGFSCYNNKLKKLNISKNINLISFTCAYNQLTNLNVSKNTNIEEFQCSGNRLTNLDVSQNIHLTILDCQRNQLKNLDFSKNANLYQLYCNKNKLKNLDVSKNACLIELYCSNNQLISLDISKNIALTDFICDHNQLISLDMKNGNNDKLILFSAQNNNLSCVDVDDEAVYWHGYMDEGVVFSNDCGNYKMGLGNQRKHKKQNKNKLKKEQHEK